MAEAFLRRRLAERMAEARVTSAGLLSGGHPCSEVVVRLVGAVGADLAGHRSRPLIPDLVEGAGLVLAMARFHCGRSWCSSPPPGPALTLKELVRRGEAVGARPAGEPLATRLARLGEGRRLDLVLVDDDDDDVADPVVGL